MNVIRVFMIGASVFVLACCRGHTSKTSATHLVETTENVLKLLPDSWPGTKYWNTTCPGLFPRKMTKAQNHSVALPVYRKYVELLLEVYKESQHIVARLSNSCHLNEQVWDTIQKTDEHLKAIFISGNVRAERISIPLTKDTVRTLNASNVFEMIQLFGQCISNNSVDKCSGIVVKECEDTKKGGNVEKVKTQKRKNKRGKKKKSGRRMRSGRRHRARSTCVCSTPKYHQSDVKRTLGLTSDRTTTTP